MNLIKKNVEIQEISWNVHKFDEFKLYLPIGENINKFGKTSIIL